MEFEGLHQHFARYDSETYESPNHYFPNDDLLRLAKTLVPIDWRTSRTNLWYHVKPSNGLQSLPVQGWKIHVSAIPSQCKEILSVVIPLCIEHNIPFKFLVDIQSLYYFTGKIQRRGGSGKFFTIYPADEEQFISFMEVLYQNLKGYSGPFILSDRRYKDCKVLYYRYGGIKEVKSPTVSGESSYKIYDPEGNLIDDSRNPFFMLPEGIIDPFVHEEEEEDAGISLNNGRYLIQSVLHYSNSGGVYKAIDSTTDRTVVIKEARPGTVNKENGEDATTNLRREFEILKSIQTYEIAPTPIDFFNEWEHSYLVEEFISGLNLGPYFTQHTPFVKVVRTQKDSQDYVGKMLTIFKKLSQSIYKIHQDQIVISDLSATNILVDEETLDIRLIDLEGAWRKGQDEPTGMRTPGYSDVRTFYKNEGEVNDVYGFGSVMLFSLFPFNNLLELDHSKKGYLIDTVGAKIGYPNDLLNLIKECMHENPSERPTMESVCQRIKAVATHSVTYQPKQQLSASDIAKLNTELKIDIEELVQYIEKSADYTREDRLFPSDPTVFGTNPLSLAYGALGIAHALKTIKNSVPKKLTSWILLKDLNFESYPPGLYIGLSGVAWGFNTLGLQDVAEHVLRSTRNHPLLYKQGDVFYGLSGYGLSCLHQYSITKDEEWLDEAKKAGDWLQEHALENESGSRYWVDINGESWTGYACGSSGIALFLLYLSKASGSQEYFTLGRAALDHELELLVKSEEGYYSTKRGTVHEAQDNVLSHYWIDGSAGVITALIRYYYVTKEEGYKSYLDLLIPDICKEYTIYPNLFQGMAGLGNVLIDAYQFLGEESYLQEAYQIYENMRLFELNRPEGKVYPGERLWRISTDLATGSAGVALYFHRLLHHDKPFNNFNFTVDELLDVKSSEVARPLVRN